MDLKEELGIDEISNTNIYRMRNKNKIKEAYLKIGIGDE